jgi:valyl-tRNA synthetase
MGKISKSRGGGPPVMELINRYSADGVRYWAASTGAGRDAVISEEKMQMGAKLVTKLWNVARFAEPLIKDQRAELPGAETPPADRWIRAALHDLVRQVTAAFDQYEYGLAKTAIEGFFWRELADNYLEMAKQRLYDPQAQGHAAACDTLRTVLRTLLKLLAPLMPFVTERIWQELYAEEGLASPARLESIHNSSWPEACPFDPGDLALGEHLIAIATAVRRYKSEHALSLGSELARLEIAAGNPALRQAIQASLSDISSVTRAREVTVLSELSGALQELPTQDSSIRAAISS